MLGSQLISAAFLFVASAVGQDSTASGFMTIQTSAADGPTVTDCIQESCFPETTGGILSILPISTSQSITLPQATTGLVTSASDSGVMSIPGGETPLSTGSGSTSAGTSTGASGSAPAQSTGAAPHAHVAGGGGSVMVVMAVSALSMLFGFVWTLA
ncbi:hypothetical protein EJ04DRAFT_512158 [Polyplosphaeria fusca]|uniref:Uncharacterized protein n=1 Tax=Polyplosphaeria fusca TaxID=682080 RepID=A0A9P4V317_9PLEO|nr:hypothetical protein EJ04DRAFT_512158 [Polyplosphaeria fusca]